MKRTIPLAITAVVGLVLIAAWFVPALGHLSDTAAIFFDILAAIALVLGGGNLLRAHGAKVLGQKPGWGYSGITIIAFAVTLVFGLFKVGVHGKPGYWTSPVMKSATSNAIGLAQLDITDTKRQLAVVVRRAEPGTKHAVLLGTTNIGEIEIDADGHGAFELAYDPATEKDAAQRNVLADVTGGETLQIGTLLSAPLTPYPAITGQYNENGSPFWFVYEYGLRPLQQTVLALLGFFVASAAFRAFRARNLESILLLTTAFIILLGRTFVGTVLTGWLPDTGFWSFFQIPNLSNWIMSIFNTAGNRAIMIGIALGVAAMSIKVLLGIDRSYLGRD